MGEEWNIWGRNDTLTAVREAIHDRVKSLSEGLSSVQALAEGKAAFVVGSYQGDCAPSQTIQLGFDPAMVIVVLSSGLTFVPNLPDRRVGGIFVQGMDQSIFRFVSGGFEVTYQEDQGLYSLNHEKRQYYYAAFY